MRKTTGILAAVVAVAVIYTGASWFVGKQAQQEIDRAVVQANARMAQALMPRASDAGAILAVSEYHRRIFSSDVVYSLRLADDQEYLLSDHLQHGPFPWAALSEGVFVPMLAFSQARLLPSASTQAWFDSLDGESPVSGRTQVRFGGSAVSEWALRPLAVAQEDEVLKFSGGSLRAKFDNDFADNQVAGGFELLDYSTDSGAERVVVENLRFESETVSAANKVRLHSTTQVAGVSLAGHDTPELALRDVVMDVASNREGDLGGGTLRYDFGQVLSRGDNLGSLSLGAGGRDFSMPALSELARVYDELSARHGQEEDWQLSPQEAALLQEKIVALLASNPVVSLDPVVWKNEQGEGRASLTVELTSPAQPAAALSLDELVQQIVRALDLELRIEKPMFVRAMGQLSGDAEDPQAVAAAEVLYDEYAGRLHAAGLASAEDQTVTTKISYRDGRIDANGRQMSLPEFMQRALLVMMM